MARLQKREHAWITGVRARASLALADGAVPLTALAADPWWAGIAALPRVLEWIVRKADEGGRREASEPRLSIDQS